MLRRDFPRDGCRHKLAHAWLSVPTSRAACPDGTAAFLVSLAPLLCLQDTLPSVAMRCPSLTVDGGRRLADRGRSHESVEIGRAYTPRRHRAYDCLSRAPNWLVVSHRT